MKSMAKSVDDAQISWANTCCQIFLRVVGFLSTMLSPSRIDLTMAVLQCKIGCFIRCFEPRHLTIMQKDDDMHRNYGSFDCHLTLSLIKMNSQFDKIRPNRQHDMILC